MKRKKVVLVAASCLKSIYIVLEAKDCDVDCCTSINGVLEGYTVQTKEWAAWARCSSTNEYIHHYLE